MGVTVSEVLESKFFKKCSLLAGGEGGYREIQAVTLFDAPDGYTWCKGKEFLITSGYLFQQHEGLFKDVILFLAKKNGAGLGIKVDRFLKEVPQEIMDLCNHLKFPLIGLPYETAWIDVIDAVNSVAINKYIMRINEYQNRRKKGLSVHSLAGKMNEVLKSLFEELKRPIVVFDLLENRTYRFPLNAHKGWPTYKELLEPSYSHQKEIVCDNLKIYRIKNLEKEGDMAWVGIPIYIGEVLVAYLAVKETREKIDYYDLFSIRLAFTLLVYTYEQIYFMNSIEGKFQDEFIQEIIQDDYKNEEKIYKKANNLKLNIAKNYLVICIQQIGPHIYLHEHREKISQKIYQTFSKEKVLFGLLNGNTIVILHASGSNHNAIKETEGIKEKCRQFIESLEREIYLSQMIGGIGHTIGSIVNIKKSYIESTKAIEIGKYIYPQEKVISYRDLGPFGLIRIESFQGEDFENILEYIHPILKQDDGKELLATLRTYLESESNYNLAAKKLFIHSNTVRYRIDKIQQLCNIDLNDPVERLKLEIILRFIKYAQHP